MPVWVANLNDDIGFKNIICPVDFSDTSKRALENAIILAKDFKAALRILAVYEPFSNASARLNLDD